MCEQAGGSGRLQKVVQADGQLLRVSRAWADVCVARAPTVTWRPCSRTCSHRLEDVQMTTFRSPIEPNLTPTAFQPRQLLTQPISQHTTMQLLPKIALFVFSLSHEVASLTSS